MPFLFTLLIIGLMVFAVVDIIRRDDSQVRYLPRIVWLLLAVIVPLLGSVLWFALGRVYPEGGIQIGRPSRRSKAPTRPSAPMAPVVPLDTRTTEEQIADLDREIEEWRLRQEIEKRKHEREDPTADQGNQDA